MKKIGMHFMQLAKALLTLTGRLVWLAARLFARWLVLVLRFVYRHRLLILDYKYTPGVVLVICTIWFFYRDKPGTQPSHPATYAPQPVAYPVSPIPDPALLAEYRDLTGVFPDKRTDLRLIHVIHSWLGTPHRADGHTRNGTDCSGFVQAVFQDVFRVALSRSSAEMYVNDVTPIPRRQLQEGDLVFFRMGGNQVSHVGIFLQDNQFVHASTTRGVMVSSLKEPYYRKYFYRAGRVKWQAM